MQWKTLRGKQRRFPSCTIHHKQKIPRQPSEDFCGSALSRAGKPELVGARPLHLAAARPFCHLKAPLGLSLFRFAPQTRTCRGEAPPSCCRKTIRSLKSPTGAFIVPLCSTSANFYFCCHVITYSFSPVASSKPLC